MPVHVHCPDTVTGDMYYEGTGIDKNVDEAFKCYERAVELGTVAFTILIMRGCIR